MLRRLLQFCFYPLNTVYLLLIQSPGVVKVPLGGTAVLRCDLVHIIAHCGDISWYKLHPRTKRLDRAAGVSNNGSEENRRCLGVITNTTVGDSGTYYCVALHTVIPCMGNGSKVFITEPSPQPTVLLYVSDESNRSTVSLQCLVMGVVPSEVRVSWVVNNTPWTGWTESAWTNDSDRAVEFTRAHVTLPSERWRDDVECIVEVDGRSISKSLKRGSYSACAWFLYPGLGTVVLIVLASVIVLVSSRTARRGGATERACGAESPIRRQHGKRGKRAAEGSCTTEVQYASVEIIRTGRNSSSLIQTC